MTKTLTKDQKKEVIRMIGRLNLYPGTVFNMQEIKRGRLFVWTINDRTIVKIARENMSPKIEGVGRQARYSVKGRNIISYLKKIK